MCACEMHHFKKSFKITVLRNHPKPERQTNPMTKKCEHMVNIITALNAEIDLSNTALA